ncbi:response regulator [Pseudomonas sp. Marseille-Q5115]|uniref:response regulator n=1 Tax=Pseudomonas sp. Marseille-Q5115 TaxID=2866593 RepID=UPI001CE491AE|nr:response regulator transcription factor [Pseudomonas sp. Marseille-Q5115]
MSCRLVLVDDHALIRAGVRALVADIPGYCVVGEAGDGWQLTELVRRSQADIVLLDLSMRGVGGLDALRQLRRSGVPCRVLVLSMHHDSELILHALQAGADGYLLKDATANELEQALQAIRHGTRYLSPGVTHAVIDQALVAHRTDRPPPTRHPLTARQMEILRLIVRGTSTRDIANGLGLSIKTVETHRAQVMKRLQIFDVAGLVLYAVRERIISPDD